MQKYNNSSKNLTLFLLFHLLTYSPFHFYLRHTSPYFYWDGFRFKAVAADSQAHHAGLAVQGLGLVEDEVTHAVIDGMALELLDGLECVGMVADEYIGSCQTEHVGIMPLTGYGLCLVLCSPVERDDDDSCGVLLTKTVDAGQ